MCVRVVCWGWGRGSTGPGGERVAGAVAGTRTERECLAGPHSPCRRRTCPRSKRAQNHRTCRRPCMGRTARIHQSPVWAWRCRLRRGEGCRWVGKRPPGSPGDNGRARAVRAAQGVLTRPPPPPRPRSPPPPAEATAPPPPRQSSIYVPSRYGESPVHRPALVMSRRVGAERVRKGKIAEGVFKSCLKNGRCQ